MAPHKVLVALDESATAFRALQWALSRAARANDEVWALAILDTRKVMIQVRAPSRGADEMASYGERVNHVLEQAGKSAAGHGVKLQSQIWPSADPAAAIVAYAHEGGFEEIVLGHREKRAVEKMVLGSTALRVLELALIPVTIVR